MKGYLCEECRAVNTKDKYCPRCHKQLSDENKVSVGDPSKNKVPCNIVHDMTDEAKRKCIFYDNFLLGLTPSTD